MTASAPTSPVRILPAGDSAFLIRVEGPADAVRNRFVQALAERIERRWPEAVLAAVPAYNSVLVEYALDRIEPLQLLTGLYDACSRHPEPDEATGKGVILPVLYGGEAGPDLETVARLTGLEVETVIRLHCEPVYRVYCVGFTPGFPYLGFLPEELEVERLERPRRRVPAGTVGIAGRQTGLYPVDSPGGWRLLGRTPVSVLRPGEDPPVLLEPGDFVRFRPVDAEEYERILRMIRAGEYRIERLEPPSDGQGGAQV